jgi:uncharacterized DUF497 family protein
MRRFEWDAEKSKKNYRDHRITFKQAVEVFSDPYAISEQDRFVNFEERWQTIGLANNLLVVIVAHTLHDEDDDTIEVVRIISARLAEPHERRRYDNRKVFQS